MERGADGYPFIDACMRSLTQWMDYLQNEGNVASLQVMIGLTGENRTPFSSDLTLRARIHYSQIANAIWSYWYKLIKDITQ